MDKFFTVLLILLEYILMQKLAISKNCLYFIYYERRYQSSISYIHRHPVVMTMCCCNKWSVGLQVGKCIQQKFITGLAVYCLQSLKTNKSLKYKNIHTHRIISKSLLYTIAIVIILYLTTF